MFSPRKGRFLRSLYTYLLVWMYEKAQLKVEYQILRERRGFSRWKAWRTTIRWKPRLRRHMDDIDTADADPQCKGYIWGWGAASDNVKRLLSSENQGCLSEFGATCSKNGVGIVHGSSETGMMGILDACWLNALTTLRASGVAIHAFIRQIPLCWIPDEVNGSNGVEQREKPPKNGGEFRLKSTPWLDLGPRTASFALTVKKLRLVLITMGGLGSMFELFFALLQWQLREKLLTCFTQWLGKPPRILLLDNFHSEVGEWYYDGIGTFLRVAASYGGLDQSQIRHVTLVRILPKDSELAATLRQPDVVGEDRIGPEIRYFEDQSSAAEYMYGEIEDQVAEEARMIQQLAAGVDPDTLIEWDSAGAPSKLKVNLSD